MKFKMFPLFRCGNEFHGMLYRGKESIGGMGRDKEGLYVNLSGKLPLNDYEELLEMIKNLNDDFGELELTVQYINSV
jgi:hypothetical protein